MCGIFGILSSDLSREQVQSQLYAGIAQLDHRGPDGWGTYFCDGVALGHTRLSIFDPKDGHQPMVSDTTVIVYNGEVYNHYELRKELEAEGAEFRTHCDTEVIQKLYERDQEKCLERLNGQFALLIWDRVRRELFVARDRLGMRPLYVMHKQGAIYFSSEMKAFDAIFPGERQFSPRALLDHALLWNSIARETVYAGVESVESGTWERYGASRMLSQKRFYDIGQQIEAATTTMPFDEAKEAFEEQLQNSVDLRLRSDVPVGAYLSGGIDSTVIATLVQQKKKGDLRTFSVEFEDRQYDESDYQQLAANAIKSKHEPFIVQADTIEKNFLNAIYHGERPIFRTAPVPMNCLSKRVRERDIRVVLTGEGADEILFGYDSFKEIKLLNHWKQNGYDAQVEKAIANLYPHLSHYADPKQFGLMKMYYEGFLNKIGNRFAGLNIRISNNKILYNYLNKDWDLALDIEDLEDRFSTNLPANFNEWSILQKNTYVEIKTLLQGYLLSSQGDRMALGNGIEGRYPFLDHNLIDFVFGLPDDHKLSGYCEKHILKQVFKDRIPEQILERPKRPYMAPDITAFFEGDLLKESAADLLSAQKITEYGCFDEKMVSRYLRKFRDGIPKNVGYRDNMIFIFLLSTQACMHWARHPVIHHLDRKKCRVEVFDYEF